MTANPGELRAPVSESSSFLRRAIALTIAVLSLGIAIQFRDGEYMFPTDWNYPAIWYVGIAILFTVIAVVPRFQMPRLQTLQAEEVARGVLLLAVVIQFVLLLRSPPSGQNPWSDDLKDGSQENLQLYYGGITAAGALSLFTFLLRRWYWIVPFVGVLAVHLLLGFWTVRSCPAPDIDVWYFQQIGGRALVEGQNPYEPIYPNIYANREGAEKSDQPVYGAKLVEGDKLKFGFPYPPVSLYLSTAARQIAGDYRYGDCVALTLAGLLIALALPSRWGASAAVLLLFTPRVFFIIGRGWTEPLVVLTLALSLFCAMRLPRLLPLALGLFIASKQYLIFAVPLAWLLVPRGAGWRGYLKLVVPAVIVALAVSLPLALRDWNAFFTSTVAAQLESPARKDALSWLVWFADRRGINPENGYLPGNPWVPFALAVCGIAGCLRWCSRSPGGFAIGITLVYLLFISFNKQAFANYYLFVIAAGVFGLALISSKDSNTAPVVT
jgi:hypothetical protein